MLAASLDQRKIAFYRLLIECAVPVDKEFFRRYTEHVAEQFFRVVTRVFDTGRAKGAGPALQHFAEIILPAHWISAVSGSSGSTARNAAIPHSIIPSSGSMVVMRCIQRPG